MIDLNRSHSRYSAAQYLESLPNETDGDGECLFRIMPAGQYLGFEGEELADFVRLCVLRLLDSGAVPVLYAQEGTLEWTEQTHYGSTNEERAGAIVAEWVAKGCPRPEWDDLWFVTRRVLETSRRWQADLPKKE